MLDTLHQQFLDSKIQPIDASVSGGALTITLKPTVLDFRSPTLGSGEVSTVNIPAALSLVVPSGATIGTVSGQKSRLLVLVLNNGGIPVLAVCNISGGFPLDETQLYGAELMSSGATAANNIYGASAAAASSCGYRVVGCIESTQAAAGVWAAAPSLVQGMGGNALAAMSGLGVGQSYQSVTRSMGTTYYNTTGKPIVIVLTNAGAFTWTVTINGFSMTASMYVAGPFIIPVGASYSVSGSATTWYELR